MRDTAARSRTGTLPKRPASHADPRIHTSLPHLLLLEGQARALSFLPRQPAQSRFERTPRFKATWSRIELRGASRLPAGR
jgi:hypothetical protein